MTLVCEGIVIAIGLLGPLNLVLWAFVWWQTLRVMKSVKARDLAHGRRLYALMERETLLETKEAIMNLRLQHPDDAGLKAAYDELRKSSSWRLPGSVVTSVIPSRPTSAAERASERERISPSPRLEGDGD